MIIILGYLFDILKGKKALANILKSHPMGVVNDIIVIWVSYS